MASLLRLREFLPTGLTRSLPQDSPTEHRTASWGSHPQPHIPATTGSPWCQPTTGSPSAAPAASERGAEAPKAGTPTFIPVGSPAQGTSHKQGPRTPAWAFAGCRGVDRVSDTEKRRDTDRGSRRLGNGSRSDIHSPRQAGGSQMRYPARPGLPHLLYSLRAWLPPGASPCVGRLGGGHPSPATSSRGHRSPLQTFPRISGRLPRYRVRPSPCRPGDRRSPFWGHPTR